MSSFQREHPKNLLKQAVLQIGAGGSAGFVEVCLMHPLDIVKTRMQLQSAKKHPNVTMKSPVYYDGIYDCFNKMYKHEGFFSFYKGILPPILAETPKRAVKFFTFEQYQKMFSFHDSYYTPLTFALAGAGAGITEAILVNPFEVVKITLQSDRSLAKDTPSTWSVTRKIIRTGGFGSRGLNKGLSGTIFRNGIFNMIYFGFYHTVKNYSPTAATPWGEFARKLSIGFTAGSLASCLNIPFDVAKSRIQGPQPVPGEIKYDTIWQTLRTIYVEEGWRALYKGLLPKIMRLGPGGAVMLVVYDYVYNFLIKKFPD